MSPQTLFISALTAFVLALAVVVYAVVQIVVTSEDEEYL